MNVYYLKAWLATNLYNLLSFLLNNFVNLTIEHTKVIYTEYIFYDKKCLKQSIKIKQIIKKLQSK
jgi:hypothetical protein